MSVKALTWEQDDANWWVAQPARMGFGYEVRITDAGNVRVRRGNADWAYFEGTADEAKAVFQADFDSLILSFVDPSYASSQAEIQSAKTYLRSLLTSFVQEHCDPVPEWAPLPDLMGMLTQIDNAITVTRGRQAEIERLRTALEPFVNILNLSEANAIKDGRNPATVPDTLDVLAFRDVPGLKLGAFRAARVALSGSNE